MRTVLTAVLSLAFAAPLRAADDLKPVRTLVENSVNKVMSILKDKSIERDAKKKKVMAVGEELFDMPLMSKLVLGRDNWPKFDPKQQKEFSDLFVKQLQDSYFEKVDLLTDETVDFTDPVLQKDGKAVMLTNIQSKNERYEMIYKLYNKKGDWKAYDVEIEGISLVKAYGSQYDEFLRKESPAALLKKLREAPFERPKDLEKTKKEAKTGSAGEKAPAPKP